jgi:hypothetical protein
MKRIAESIAWLVVVALKYLTSWYIVGIWAFLFPFLMGEGVFLSLFFCSLAMFASYKMWSDFDNYLFEAVSED